MDMLKDHLAFRLYQEKTNEKPKIDKISIAEATEKCHLTKREEMVVRLLMNGIENEVICEELAISPEIRLKNIF